MKRKFNKSERIKELLRQGKTTAEIIKALGKRATKSEAIYISKLRNELQTSEPPSNPLVALYTSPAGDPEPVTAPFRAVEEAALALQRFDRDTQAKRQALVDELTNAKVKADEVFETLRS